MEQWHVVRGCVSGAGRNHRLLFVGLIAGFLAGKVMKGGGFGIIGDIVVGLVGAFIGGLLFGSFVDAQYRLVGSIFVAFIGACILIFLIRLIRKA